MNKVNRRYGSNLLLFPTSMKTYIKPLSILLLTIAINIFFTSCSDKKKEKPIGSFLETALQQAGDNRAELEKVLNYYSVNASDSLKYKAACFLIENMPYYTYYKGKLLDQYLTYYSLLKDSQGKNIKPQILADSINSMYGAFELDSLEDGEQNWK